MLGDVTAHVTADQSRDTRLYTPIKTSGATHRGRQGWAERFMVQVCKSEQMIGSDGWQVDDLYICQHVWISAASELFYRYVNKS